MPPIRVFLWWGFRDRLGMNLLDKCCPQDWWVQCELCKPLSSLLAPMPGDLAGHSLNQTQRPSAMQSMILCLPIGGLAEASVHSSLECIIDIDFSGKNVKWPGKVSMNACYRVQFYSEIICQVKLARMFAMECNSIVK